MAHVHAQLSHVLLAQQWDATLIIDPRNKAESAQNFNQSCKFKQSVSPDLDSPSPQTHTCTDSSQLQRDCMSTCYHVCACVPRC
jgi:hypothetical protein